MFRTKSLAFQKGRPEIKKRLVFNCEKEKKETHKVIKCNR